MSVFSSREEALDHLNSFAKGDPVSVYQVGSNLQHFGVVHTSPVAKSSVHLGDYTSLDVKLRNGGLIMSLSDKMMADGSWVISYKGLEDQEAESKKESKATDRELVDA